MKHINENTTLPDHINYILFKKMAFFLINSNYNDNRERVAQIGYGLDKLVYDISWTVKEQVAKHGYGLDILINDISQSVRVQVAKQGYGLDILVNDENNWVRKTAKIEKEKR